MVLNSFLSFQCVSNTPPLAHYFISRSFEEDVNQKYSETKGYVAAEFAEVNHPVCKMCIYYCITFSLGFEGALVIAIQVNRPLRLQVPSWKVQDRIRGERSTRLTRVCLQVVGVAARRYKQVDNMLWWEEKEIIIRDHR